MKKILICSAVSILISINAIDCYFTSRFIFDFVALLAIGYFISDMTQYLYFQFCEILVLYKNVKNRKKDERGMIDE